MLGKRSIDFDELANSEKFDEPENFSKRGWFANLFTGYHPKREAIDKRLISYVSIAKEKFEGSRPTKFKCIAGAASAAKIAACEAAKEKISFLLRKRYFLNKAFNKNDLN